MEHGKFSFNVLGAECNCSLNLNMVICARDASRSCLTFPVNITCSLMACVSQTKHLKLTCKFQLEVDKVMSHM